MSGPPKAWLMLSIECGFGARGAVDDELVRRRQAEEARAAGLVVLHPAHERGPRPDLEIAVVRLRRPRDAAAGEDRGELRRRPPAREDVAGSGRTGRLSGGGLRCRRTCLGGELGLEAEAEERGG